MKNGKFVRFSATPTGVHSFACGNSFETLVFSWYAIIHGLLLFFFSGFKEMRPQNGLVPKSYVYSLFVRRGILCTRLHRTIMQSFLAAGRLTCLRSLCAVFSTPDFTAKDPVEFHVFTRELLRLKRGGASMDVGMRINTSTVLRRSHTKVAPEVNRRC